jgi:putative membrane protein
MVGLLDVSGFPLVNATLNCLSASLLIIALWLIKKKNIRAHKNTMLLAFGTSIMFLVTYVIYHWFKAGPKVYTGDYVTIYYFILITHIILAICIIPLALITLYRGWYMQKAKHRKIARITYPVWLYVSITGVVIYMMLY